MAMEISQSALARLWLYAFLLGVGLGAVYDAFRIFRVFLGVSYSERFSARLNAVRLPLLPQKAHTRPARILPAVVLVQDLLFGILTGVSVAVLFYWFNNGILRAPAILCTILGFFVYRMTLGRLVMLFSQVIATLVEWFFRYLFFFVALPFRFLFKWGMRMVSSVYRHVHLKRQCKARARCTDRFVRQIESNACGLLPQEKNK